MHGDSQRAISSLSTGGSLILVSADMMTRVMAAEKTLEMRSSFKALRTQSWTLRHKEKLFGPMRDFAAQAHK